MKKAIERLKEAVRQEDALAKGTRLVVAQLWIELGPHGFWAVAREFMGMNDKVIFPDEFYRDEIAAIERERAEEKQASDPEIYPMPKPGDRLTAGQLKDAPDGTVVDMPSIAGGMTRFTKNVGFWLNGSTAASGLSGECTLVRWGSKKEDSKVVREMLSRPPTPRPTGVLTHWQVEKLEDGAAVLTLNGLIYAERWNGMWYCTGGKGTQWTSEVLGKGPWLLLRRVDHG